MKRVLFFASFVVLIAADWTEWRGPHRDGAITAEPKAWPEKLKQKWKITVGEGHASPILAGGSIFIFSRQEGQETALCIDPATGTIRWKKQYPAPYKLKDRLSRLSPLVTGTKQAGHSSTRRICSSGPLLCEIKM